MAKKRRYEVVMTDSRRPGVQKLALYFPSAHEARQSMERVRARHGYSPFWKYKVRIVRKRSVRHKASR